MPTLVPPELGGEARRYLHTAGLILGVLLFGVLALALIAGAFKVSDMVGFGIWGGVGVVVLGVLGGVVAWVRSRSAARSTPVPRGASSPDRRTPTGRVVALPKRLSDALDGTPGTSGTRTTKDQAWSPPARANAAGAMDTAGASGGRVAYYQALETGDLAAAAAVLARLRAAGENPAWCDNADRRLEHLRRRA